MIIDFEDALFNDKTYKTFPISSKAFPEPFEVNDMNADKMNEYFENIWSSYSFFFQKEFNVYEHLGEDFYKETIHNGLIILQNVFGSLGIEQDDTENIQIKEDYLDNLYQMVGHYKEKETTSIYNMKVAAAMRYVFAFLQTAISFDGFFINTGNEYRVEDFKKDCETIRAYLTDIAEQPEKREIIETLYQTKVNFMYYFNFFGLTTTYFPLISMEGLQIARKEKEKNADNI